MIILFMMLIIVLVIVLFTTIKEQEDRNNPASSTLDAESINIREKIKDTPQWKEIMDRKEELGRQLHKIEQHKVHVRVDNWKEYREIKLKDEAFKYLRENNIDLDTIAKYTAENRSITKQYHLFIQDIKKQEYTFSDDATENEMYRSVFRSMLEEEKLPHDEFKIRMRKAKLYEGDALQKARKETFRIEDLYSGDALDNIADDDENGNSILDQL